MRHLFLFVSVVAACFCGACSTTSELVDVNDVDLKQKCDEDSVMMEYIAIDGMYPVWSDKYFIQSVDKIVTYKQMVYILDWRQATIYCYNTKTLQIEGVLDKRGHSKKEYLSASDFAIDPKGNIVVYDADGGKILWYDRRGNYLKSCKVEVGGESFAIRKDGTIAIDCCHSEPNVGIKIYSPDGSKCTVVHQDDLFRQFAMGHESNMAWHGNDLYYVRPYDYTIYKVGADNKPVGFMQLDFGKKNFDFSEFKGLDYAGFQQKVFKTKSVLLLRYLSVYKNLFFVSTDRADNIMFDAGKNKIYMLSNMKDPYGILLESPLFIDDKGELLTYVRTDNVEWALRPWFEHSMKSGDYVPKFFQKAFQKKYENVSCWLVKGHIKK